MNSNHRNTAVLILKILEDNRLPSAPFDLSQTKMNHTMFKDVFIDRVAVFLPHHKHDTIQ